MSEELAPDNFPIHVTSFWGGKDRGQCIQLSPFQPNSRYAELDLHQVEQLKLMLEDWLDDAKRDVATGNAPQ